jgi:protein tyrosine phosphatase
MLTNKLQGFKLIWLTLEIMDINKLPLTLSPRPKLRDIHALAKEHDIFVTLLMNSEKAREIGLEVEKAGRLWWHCPFSILPMNQGKFDFNLVVITVEKLCQALIDKKRIFIHCDAGIDRTGTIVLATLICLGFKKRQAAQFLVSWQLLAEDRMHWDYVDKLVKAVREGRRKIGLDSDYHSMLARAYDDREESR